ncbi:DUF4177 domain-containing protein [Aeribacillus pallidus]
MDEQREYKTITIPTEGFWAEKYTKTKEQLNHYGAEGWD